MTNGDRIRSMDNDTLARFIMSLIKGEGEPEGYDYVCTNCPASNCTLFEPEERCCWATLVEWLGEEAGE